MNESCECVVDDIHFLLVVALFDVLPDEIEKFGFVCGGEVFKVEFI